jgi:1-deoxy-D-xylulose-5-phosphate reductoisomerase
VEEAYRSKEVGHSITKGHKHMKSLVILGSTGSIGTQALDVCRNHPEQYRVLALAAGENVAVLAQQIQEFQPSYVSVKTPDARHTLLKQLQEMKLPVIPDCAVGCEGLHALATLPEADDVLVGVVGIVGLAPTLAALQAGKRVLTANKETFVAGGHLVQPYLQQVVPFDSEHNALLQSLQGSDTTAIKALWLTASGGPFRDLKHRHEFDAITPEQALKHPNWRMGTKVTIDSATLMNKGLELIEAHWLFGVPSERLKVLVHPQSIVHGLVEYTDGSVMSQLGPADMRIPIQVAMSWPSRWDGAYMCSHLDVAQLSQLTFYPPDETLFPALPLARQAMETGPAATIALNAADEVAVQAFLERRIRFLDIVETVARVLEALPTHEAASQPLPDLEAIDHLDAWARQQAYSIMYTGQTM